MIFILAIIIGLRILWQIYPGLLFCCLFWIVSMMFDAVRFRACKSHLESFGASTCMLGALSNAVVTIANNGFMPVPNVETFSLWVKSTSEHKLMFLADIYAGFSLGDFILLSGVSIVMFAKIIYKSKPDETPLFVETQVVVVQKRDPWGRTL